MCDELAAFMDQHKFKTIADSKATACSISRRTAELVRMQADAKATAKQEAAAEGGEEDGDGGQRMARRRFRKAVRGAAPIGSYTGVSPVHDGETPVLLKVRRLAFQEHPAVLDRRRSCRPSLQPDREPSRPTVSLRSASLQTRCNRH